jgi:hypothetical protein|tara:strand:- start:2137 stop:2301 length:165 start_codon:yes stop_codon:yes gene_type:complete
MAKCNCDEEDNIQPIIDSIVRKADIIRMDAKRLHHVPGLKERAEEIISLAKLLE